MALRIKAGGQASVVPVADIKKSGLIKTTSTNTTPKEAKPADKNEKPRPLTAAPTTTTAVVDKKPSPGINTAAANKKPLKPADNKDTKAVVEEDPIEKSLNERIKAGGVSNVVPSTADKKPITKASDPKPKPAALSSTTALPTIKPAPTKPEEKKDKPASAVDAKKKELLKSDKAIVASSAPKIMKGKRKATDDEDVQPEDPKPVLATVVHELPLIEEVVQP